MSLRTKTGVVLAALILGVGWYVVNGSGPTWDRFTGWVTPVGPGNGGGKDEWRTVTFTVTNNASGIGFVVTYMPTMNRDGTVHVPGGNARDDGAEFHHVEHYPVGMHVALTATPNHPRTGQHLTCHMQVGNGGSNSATGDTRPDGDCHANVWVD